MNKKVIVILLILIVLVLVVSYIFYNKKFSVNNIGDNEEKVNKKISLHKCEEKTGGSFNVYFESNGGNEIEFIHVGIAVSPDSYDDLEVPVKDGYIFDGWYYDKEFNTKVNGDNAIDINPVPEKDKYGCNVGFKDLTLYAKWKEEE